MVAPNGTTPAPEPWDSFFASKIPGERFCPSSHAEDAVGRLLWCDRSRVLVNSLKRLGDLMQHTAIQLGIESESDISTLFEMRGHVEALYARACTIVTRELLDGLRLVENQWQHETAIKCCAEELRLSLSELSGKLSRELQEFDALANRIGDHFRRRPLSENIRDQIRNQIGTTTKLLFDDGHVVISDYAMIAETFYQVILGALERTRRKIADECGPEGS